MALYDEFALFTYGMLNGAIWVGILTLAFGFEVWELLVLPASVAALAYCKRAV